MKRAVLLINPLFSVPLPAWRVVGRRLGGRFNQGRAMARLLIQTLFALGLGRLTGRCSTRVVCS